MTDDQADFLRPTWHVGRCICFASRSSVVAGSTPLMWKIRKHRDPVKTPHAHTFCKG